MAWLRAVPPRSSSQPAVGKTEGMPCFTKLYWSERMKKTCSGSGSGETDNPSAAAAAAAARSSELWSAPIAIRSCGFHKPAPLSQLTSATMLPMGTVGWRAK